jgi:hypothetical protein
VQAASARRRRWWTRCCCSGATSARQCLLPQQQQQAASRRAARRLQPPLPRLCCPTGRTSALYSRQSLSCAVWVLCVGCLTCTFAAMVRAEQSRAEQSRAGAYVVCAGQAAVVWPVRLGSRLLCCCAYPSFIAQHVCTSFISQHVHNTCTPWPGGSVVLPCNRLSHHHHHTTTTPPPPPPHHHRMQAVTMSALFV